MYALGAYQGHGDVACGAAMLAKWVGCHHRCLRVLFNVFTANGHSRAAQEVSHWIGTRSTACFALINTSNLRLKTRSTVAGPVQVQPRDRDYTVI